MAEKHVACYIINTGEFMGKKVKKEDTLGILESIVEKRAEFKKWGPFSDIELCEWPGFIPDMRDAAYVRQLQARMQDRLDYLKNLNERYEDFIFNKYQGKRLIIDVDDLDFQHIPEHFAGIVDKIDAILFGLFKDEQ